jgi:molybdate transport system regulatory protein
VRKRRGKSEYVLKPRFRIVRGGVIVLGPGKADLLEAIAQTGKLREAARRLSMSYMRAWQLVQAMNAAFGQPLVETLRGGATHGSARLTPLGKRALRLYRRIERQALTASASPWETLRRDLPRKGGSARTSRHT